MSFENLVPMRFDLPATVAADTEETWDFFTVPAEVTVMQLIQASVWNQATIADATNYCTVDIYNFTTSTIMATVSFAAITADTPKAFTLSTTAASTKALGSARITINKLDPGTGAAWTIPGGISSWWLLGATRT